MGTEAPVRETVYGPMALPDDPTDLIRRFLESYGEWGYLEALIVNQLSMPGARVVDVGAFIGTFGLGVANLGASQVVAVEPSAEPFRLLEQNFQTNCTIPYHLVRAAAGPVEGEGVRRSATEGNWGATSWVESDDSPADAGERVRLATLKTLRQAYGPYDVLKLDVEGYEAQVLEGDRDWIAACKPIVWAECNEDTRVEGVLNFLLSAGLEPQVISYPCFRQLSFRRPDRDIFPIAYEAALVGADPGWSERLDLHRLGEPITARPVASFRDLREALWLTPRWGNVEWTRLSKHELIALLGRAWRREEFSSFLV